MALAALAAAAPILGPVASLLGGLFGRSRTSYQIPPYAEIIKQAEAAGLNPLFALSNAPGQTVTQDRSGIGAAFAQAGALAVDALNNRKPPQEERLRMQNEQLQEKVNELTLRPPVAGVYTQRAGVSPVPQPSGVVNGPSAADNRYVTADGVRRGRRPYDLSRPLAQRFSLDPRRAVNNTDFVADPGIAYIDNPETGRPFPVPAFNGEILDLGQAAVLAGAKAVDQSLVQRDIRASYENWRPVALNAPNNPHLRRGNGRVAGQFARDAYWTGFAPLQERRFYTYQVQP